MLYSNYLCPFYNKVPKNIPKVPQTRDLNLSPHIHFYIPFGGWSLRNFLTKIHNLSKWRHFCRRRITNARKRIFSMAKMSSILDRMLNDNINFDILTGVSFLFDSFLLFWLHQALERISGFAIFLRFALVRFHDDKSVAKLLCPPHLGSYEDKSTVASNFLAILSHLAGRKAKFLPLSNKQSFFKPFAVAFHTYAIVDVIIPSLRS